MAQVGAVEVVPQLGRRRLERARRRQGVPECIDQHVDTAEVVEHRRAHLGRRVGVGEIAHDATRPDPARLDVRHHVRRPLLVDVDDHHCLGALVSEQCADGAADPPGASCHERDTLGEQRMIPTTVVVGRIRRVTLIHRRTPPAADGALRRAGRGDCRADRADIASSGSKLIAPPRDRSAWVGRTHEPLTAASPGGYLGSGSQGRQPRRSVAPRCTSSESGRVTETSRQKGS